MLGHRTAFVFSLLIAYSFMLIAWGGQERYAYGEEVRGVTSDTIKLGVIGDMTGPGVDVWQPCVNAIKTYMQHLNDNGGIHGRKIKLIIEDDRFSIPSALAAFKKLIYKDKILALVGASGQGQTYAIIPKIEKERVPLFAVLADPKYIVPPRKYIYAVLPFYSDQVKVIFEYLWNDLKVKNPKIAFLYMDSASSKPVVPLVRRLVKEYGASLVEIIIPIAGLDMTSEALRLKKENPDYVIVNGYITNTAAVLRSAKRFRFNKPFIVTQYGAVKTTLELAKDAAQGLMGINCFGSYNDESSGMAKVREIRERYDPGSGYQNRNYLQGWFLGLVTNEALKNAGKELNGETLIQGLERMSGLDTKGICGMIDFSPDDHKALENHRIFKADMEKTMFVPITDWRKAKE